MTDSPTEDVLKEAIAKIEARTEPISEHRIREEIHCLRPKDDPSPRSAAWVAEVMAFHFCEHYPNNDTGWGTYFEPMGTGTTDDGTPWELPPLSRVTPEVLEYWMKRAGESKHPVLRGRYAGLVWDLSRKAANMAPPVEAARIRIDSVVEIATLGCNEHPSHTVEQLEHALEIALSIRDEAGVERVRDAILAFADRIGEDGKAGLWCFVFDSLWGQKKVPITEDQKTKIINDLEGRLGRLADIAGNHPIDPWGAEDAAVRLAKHYRAVGRPEDVRRVLLKFGAAFDKIAEQAVPLLAQAWAQHVHQVYRDFGLKDDAEFVLRRIRELGPKVLGDLKTISAEMKVTKEEMDEYVQEMIDGDLDAAFGRVVEHYLPREDQVVKQVRDLAAKAPLSSLFHATLMDHKGRPAATVGSIEDDLEGRVVKQMAQDMQFSAVFLRRVMIALVGKFTVTPEVLTEYLGTTPLFEDDAKPLVARGVKAYLDGDAIAAMHVLIPQVENAIRVLVENTGGTVFRPNRSGGIDLKTFDELLRDDCVSAVFGGEDVPLYFRVLFTDRRGVNLRNDVCHGIAPASKFNLAFADRVVHALLILARVRKREMPAGQPTDQGDEQ